MVNKYVKLKSRKPKQNRKDFLKDPLEGYPHKMRFFKIIDGLIRLRNKSLSYLMPKLLYMDIPKEFEGKIFKKGDNVAIILESKKEVDGTIKTSNIILYYNKKYDIGIEKDLPPFVKETEGYFEHNSGNKVKEIKDIVVEDVGTNAKMFSVILKNEKGNEVKVPLLRKNIS